MDKLKDNYQEFISDPKRRRIFEREALTLEVSELICELMDAEGVSKTDLAKMIGSSKSHISQLLNGSRNMTVHTLSDLAFALGHKLRVKPVPLQAASERPNSRYIAGDWAAYTPSVNQYSECLDLISDADQEAASEILMPAAA
jgi:transcriptional regulator with XRE-family HTH domain